MRYAVIDADGRVVNLIEWDGSAETWAPPPKHTVEPVKADHETSWSSRSASDDKSIEERIKALEIKTGISSAAISK